MLYNDTITLFNRVAGGLRGDRWIPTVIEGVHLDIDRAAIAAKYGATSKDEAAVHIRYTSQDGIMVAGKRWMPPREWDKTEDSLTFTAGDQFDFFWKGEWMEGIVEDVGYGEEGFYGFMNRTHDYVFAISSVAMFDLIPHFEIMGR